MKIIFYSHGGSGNHGCEAILRTLLRQIEHTGCPVLVFTNNIEEDRKYIHEFDDVNFIKNDLNQKSLIRLFEKVFRKLTGFHKYDYYLTNKQLFKRVSAGDICISIGGDNYCYTNTYKQLAYVNRKLKKKKAHTVLYGCSITPELLSNPSVAEDMNNYSLIVARESLTYEALHSIKPKSKVILQPDSAFFLPVDLSDADRVVKKRDYVGINLSPLVINLESDRDILKNNYRSLIKHIINGTDMDLLLIPHVVFDHNDDRIPLKELYDEFSYTGRIVLVGDCNCEKLKGYISKCKYFIGARTHSTIAAYSLCIPTLVLGYSIKSKGIALDLFGSYDRYVLTVDRLAGENCLTDAFRYYEENYESIRNELRETIPQYIGIYNNLDVIIKDLIRKDK